jgi:indolepyruvate ferredoxin oxidoreductase beta subunit
MRKIDIVLAGVGGQGVLTVAAIIAATARIEGLHVKQVEAHGMAQRGGAVQAHLRVSEQPIASDLIPRGTADMILGLEPVESLRYLSFLGPGGTLITSTAPVLNVPDYPPIEDVLAQLQALPDALLLPAEQLARTAGSKRYTNVVLVGAASHLLPVATETIEDHLQESYAAKGTDVVEGNLRAFRAGREAAACARR